MSKLIKVRTDKSIELIIEKIKEKASLFDFVVRGVFDMGKEFRRHGVEVDKGFEYYSVMLCNPEKAYRGIVGNKIRGALLLPSKQVVIYKENEETVIAYVKREKGEVEELLPGDSDFCEGLGISCGKIEGLIKLVGGDYEI